MLEKKKCEKNKCKIKFNYSLKKKKFFFNNFFNRIKLIFHEQVMDFMIKKIYKLLILLQNLHKFLITIKNEKIIIKKKLSSN